MAVEVIGTIKPKNGKGFPVVEAADVAMPDGKRLSEFEGGAGEAPTFDLIALGLPAVGPSSGFKGVTCDTSAIRAALDKGAVQFKVKLLRPDGVTEYEATILMGSIETVGDGGSKAFTCSCRASGNYELGTEGISLTDFAELTIIVTEVNVMAVMANLLHVPSVTEASNGKVLTVVNGEWQAAEAPKGADVVVDAELSETSENPVQNKVLTQAFNQAMTEISGAMEEMGKAIENAGVTVDSELSATSENPVQNKVITQTMNAFAESVENALANVSTPTFDLAALGLATLTLGGYAELQTDTTAIMAALDKGAVKFVLNVNLGEEMSVGIVMNNMGADGMHVCSTTMMLDGLLALTLQIADGGIFAVFANLNESMLPYVGQEDEGKFLQVSGGVWQAVSLTDVSVEGA